MGDLISRDRALKALEEAKLFIIGMRFGKTILTEYAKQCREILIDSVRGVESADAVYVRHGAWIDLGKSDKGSRILKCSACGTIRKGVSRSTYCRDCGAKMDLLDITEETMVAMVNVGDMVHGYVLDETVDVVEQESFWPKENPYLKKGKDA